MVQGRGIRESVGGLCQGVPLGAFPLVSFPYPPCSGGLNRASGIPPSSDRHMTEHRDKRGHFIKGNVPWNKRKEGKA